MIYVYLVQYYMPQVIQLSQSSRMSVSIEDSESISLALLCVTRVSLFLHSSLLLVWASSFGFPPQFNAISLEVVHIKLLSQRL